MDVFRQVTSHTAVLPQANIDTDQIIPARFLKITDKQGLGENAFYDWRYDEQGKPNPAFVLNQNPFDQAGVLVAGDNFGCGSSREHAPWALLGKGFRAVISTRIADIFSNNALKNGLLPIVVDSAFHQKLTAQPGATVNIDLEQQTVTLAEDGARVGFTIDPFARYCMLHGIDHLDFLLQQEEAIKAYEEAAA
ncbi:3-isopropylmalate dehydratase small subunit [Acanthopleuribacter pedis]|uniref:3-isopropylmalate dehydratase small subunit n=1 Tax=Acanthopleuribacter pedis TaxID=442870 RepID=A0A8J7QFF3_9BACT|nr:3-isopropylmalate dehydratase small subunit [Acanthopleuribacter pedis]MBO1318890.1 3-isopropylmalate dehydratase small subunit [Acanthopleuribacter pedis]